MAEEPTLRLLGENMQRMFRELREMREEMRAGFGELRDEMTVLTGAFMRHDAEREGDRLSAAGLLAKQRRIEARLTEIERRLGSLEGAET
jgi:hypothetical protein